MCIITLNSLSSSTCSSGGRCHSKLQSWPKLLGRSALPPSPSSILRYRAFGSVRRPNIVRGEGGGIILSSYMNSSVWEWSTEFVVSILSMIVDSEAAFQLILTRIVVSRGGGNHGKHTTVHAAPVTLRVSAGKNYNTLCFLCLQESCGKCWTETALQAYATNKQGPMGFGPPLSLGKLLTPISLHNLATYSTWTFISSNI